MTVNVGIIGLGIMGADHANIIQSKVSNAKVTSVYDKNINQAQRIIETLDNPEIHNSGLELINSNKVDAVMVVSPDDSHVEFVLESSDNIKNYDNNRAFYLNDNTIVISGIISIINLYLL